MKIRPYSQAIYSSGNYNGHVWTESSGKRVPVGCQGPIISIDIAEEDNTLESDV